MSYDCCFDFDFVNLPCWRKANGGAESVHELGTPVLYGWEASVIALQQACHLTEERFERNAALLVSGLLGRHNHGIVREIAGESD